MGTVVLGTGSCLPQKVLTNSELEKIVDTSDEWIRNRTGIESRRIASGDEYTYRLATEAARNALEMAKIEPAELDLIVVGTITPHMLMPSTACFVQKELGAVNAFAWDLNAACSGFLYGMDVADKYLRADPDKKILVIGAETMSTRINWRDRGTCIIFGDGAGAAVFGHDDHNPGFIGSFLRSDGSLWGLLHMSAPKSLNADLQLPGNGEAHIVMEGREVFRYAVKAQEDAVRCLLEREKIAIDEIDLVIPHQANSRIINKFKERLQLPEDKIFINVSKYGNTSAASIPIALDEACRGNRIKPGDLLLFCSFGGGCTWGAGLLKW
ncbi:MAG: beta-ketoacyl-ACP synthase III [Desulfopila sp.]